MADRNNQSSRSSPAEPVLPAARGTGRRVIAEQSQMRPPLLTASQALVSTDDRTAFDKGLLEKGGSFGAADFISGLATLTQQLPGHARGAVEPASRQAIAEMPWQRRRVGRPEVAETSTVPVVLEQAVNAESVALGWRGGRRVAEPAADVAAKSLTPSAMGAPGSFRHGVASREVSVDPTPLSAKDLTAGTTWTRHQRGWSVPTGGTKDQLKPTSGKAPPASPSPPGTLDVLQAMLFGPPNQGG